MNEPNVPFDSSSQSGLEQCLNNLKPRKPFIDIDAIAKIAEGENSVEEVLIATTPRSKSWYSPTAFVGILAASWICGVAVGGSVVFFSLTSDKPTDRDSNVTVSVPTEQVQEPKAPTSTNPSSFESKFESKTAEAGELASLDFARWDLELGTEPLQVGMSLRARSRLVRTGILSSTSAKVRSLERGSSDLQNAIGTNWDASTQLPTNPVTQSELLKSLLQDANKNIH